MGSHTKPCVFFPLTIEDQLDKEKFISHLRTGLQNVLTHIPIIGGQLRKIENEFSVLRHNYQPIQLYVHHLDISCDFPTYDQLAISGFNPNLFSDIDALLFPPDSDLHSFRYDDGCPISVFQANFIRGGLVLTLALYHKCGDAKSIDHIFTLWASSTKAAKDGQPMPSWKPILDRSYFSASSTPSIAETEELKKLIRGFNFYPASKGEAANHPLPPTPPPMTLQMYHFSAESCAKLKNICKPTEPGRFVSSYDCITGLTWRCMTRARVPYLKLDVENTKSNCAHAVDTRGRFGDIVPKEYFGNGFCIGVTENLTIAKLIGDTGLPKAAQAIRQSILDVKESSIPAFVKVRKGIEGRERMRWIWAPQNVMSTSWTGMQGFTNYDFGYGLPASIRRSAINYEGALGVLPANRMDGKSDGFDVYVALEKGSQERLQADVEYQEYCSLL